MTQLCDGVVVRVVGSSNPAPTTIHLLCTTECQMACPGCFYKTSQARGAWTIEAGRQLVSEAKEMGVKWIALGGGEPTLWEPLSLFCEICADAGIAVAVTTNGRTLRLPSAIDAVHISHDQMHTRSSTSLVGRISEVELAIKYYRDTGVPIIGLNTNVNDTAMLDPMLLEQVDNVTLLLPKPIPDTCFSRCWRDMIRARTEFVGKYTQVCYDSCLSVLMGNGECLQGRTSIAFDQWGAASACSNIKNKIGSAGLRGAWDYVRLRDDRYPFGCLVKEAMKKNEGIKENDNG